MNSFRPVLIVLGCICVALGFIGIFIPLFPTTPFILVASFLFFRSSPKFHHWLENSKIFGPYLQEWHSGRGFSTKRKRNILFFQGIITIATLIFAPFWIAKIMVCISFVGIAIFLAWLPSVDKAPTQIHKPQIRKKIDKQTKKKNQEKKEQLI